MSKQAYGLHWFRRDLRVAANPALQWHWKQHSGRVLGVFCFDKEFLARPDFAPARFLFFLHTLAELQKELRAQGSDLIFLDIGPDAGFEQLFQNLKARGHALPATISWNRDYEPFARNRDARLMKIFADASIHVHTDQDHLLIEPDAIIKATQPDKPYQVYSPFQRQWLQVFQGTKVQERLKNQQQGFDYLALQKAQKAPKIFSLTWPELLGHEMVTNQDGVFQHYRQMTQSHVTISLPPAGSLAAWQRLEEFRHHVTDYAKERDFPALASTSRLSIYFKNGSLTSAQVVAAIQLDPHAAKESGTFRFLAELIWREFYYYILFKFPEVETMSFLSRYRQIAWENREDWFLAWKNGETGFPIVDAGMRELKTTGWMHNRVRMIVASFLTKDLLINWQWGERYFMETLLDGDLAPNNGGWQWAASTGCDPQPYFRIFNPLLQSQKFDPEGQYIRRFIPELSHIKGKEIHEPSADARGSRYPRPIVDHARQRDKALALYKAAQET